MCHGAVGAKPMRRSSGILVARLGGGAHRVALQIGFAVGGGTLGMGMPHVP